MSRNPWSRCLTALLVLVLLASPILVFGGGFSSYERDARSGSLWHFLSRLLSVLETAHGTMDPNGQPAAGSDSETSSADADARGTMDPNG